ncbi:MAG TPA: hypothetical protein VFA20_12560 [Myxococcaceae bacterium]|nr:hypothetical protein [Myxococcaceae bacterium]
MIGRTVRLELNRFDEIPPTLRADSSSDKAVSHVLVDLGRLYHHYYFDTWESQPPDPNPAQFEPLRFLTEGPDFRFQGSGLGASSTAKKQKSNELGQAFCRWFLYEHVGLTYFAHISNVLNRPAHPGFRGLRIVRSSGGGDAPDYLCARKTRGVYLAEAKGRYSSIGFGSKEFASWRSQFEHVLVFDRNNKPRRLKGYIVATRYGTERNVKSVMTTLFAEDPVTPGENDFDDDETQGPNARVAIISTHYSNIFGRLGLRLFAASLRQGFSVPRELSPRAVIWQCLVPPLQGRKFIGGYFTMPGISWESKLGTFIPDNPFVLPPPEPTFFGVELGIAQLLVRATYGEQALLQNIPQMEEADNERMSNFSALRDGTVLAPLDYFRPVVFDFILPSGDGTR